MSCDRLKVFLEPFLDGELDVETTVHMLKHLELCPPCRAEARNSQALRATVESACREPLDPGTCRAMLDGACACGLPATRSPPHVWVVAAAALLGGAFVAAVVMARG